MNENPETQPEFQEAGQEQPATVAEPEIDHQQKAEDYYNQLIRLQAEFANFRKRSEKEKMDALRLGKEMILEELINLTDVMDQALKHSNNASDIAALKQGFQMVKSEWMRFLKTQGAEPLETQGQTFDPHLHEAVEQIETEAEADNNKIMEEFQTGYLLNGKLLRPARVKVAKKKG